jgi:hypothetical protein
VHFLCVSHRGPLGRKAGGMVGGAGTLSMSQNLHLIGWALVTVSAVDPKLSSDIRQPPRLSCLAHIVFS